MGLWHNETPEGKMWAAVLHRAVQDCFDGNQTNMGNAWFWIYKGFNGFNSFENVCTYTNCCGGKIKRLVAREFMKQLKDPFNNKTNLLTVIYRQYKDEINKYAGGKENGM